VQQLDWQNNAHMIAHWSSTIILWAILAIILVKVSKQRFSFDLFGKIQSIKPIQWAGVALCFAISLAISYFAWGGFKVVIEFQNLGPLLFAFQYIYYMAETLLFVLIIAFGQKAGEIWFKKPAIPYGGIIVALTWGLVHILTQGSLFVGLYSAFLGLLLGLVYLLLNKKFTLSLLVLFLIFVI
jgi:hypothetical protein